MMLTMLLCLHIEFQIIASRLYPCCVFGHVHPSVLWLLLRYPMGRAYYIILLAALYLVVWLDIIVSYTKYDSMTQAKRSLQYVLNLLPSLSSTIVNDNEAQCTSDWINGTAIQFVAFSVNNFSAVYFLMPYEFSVNNESAYVCLFDHDAGQMNTAVTKLGGSELLDRFNHTLHLHCRIPGEIQRSARDSITFTLGEFLIRIRDVTNFDLLTSKIWGTVNDTSFVFVGVMGHSAIVNLIKLET